MSKQGLVVVAGVVKIVQFYVDGFPTRQPINGEFHLQIWKILNKEKLIGAPRFLMMTQYIARLKHERWTLFLL